MSNSFWTANLCVPQWKETLNQLWTGNPPKLLDPTPAKRSIHIPPDCEIRLAVIKDSGAISEFWSRYFSISTSCRCAVSKEFILKSMASGRWQTIVAVVNDQIVGTIVRRYLKGLHIYETRWTNAGMIDYFCIHPSWRNRGIGRCLLDTIHNITGLPMAPHLIFWEGLRPTLPPLVCGWFWSKRCNGTETAILLKTKEEILQAWKNCVKGEYIWTEEPGDEISVWKIKETSVIVWNTMHLTIPDGKPIGIVLSDLDSATLLANTKSYWGVLLTPQASPFAQKGWIVDSIFQWIGYNLSVGRFTTHFPKLGC